MSTTFTTPPVADWNVGIAADEAALKIMLNALRDARNGAEDIIFHPGVGFAVTYLISTSNFSASPSMVFGINSDLEV